MAKEAKSYTLEEQLVSQVAREFGPEDVIGAVGVLMFALVGVALAQRLYAPNLAIGMDAKGRMAWLSNLRFPFELGKPPEDCIETLFNAEEVLELQLKGRWNILMQPAQIDKFGNMNISAIGDWKKPTAALVGARGVPDNTTNGGRIYYTVANHTNRVFVEKVDFICGLGHGPEREQGIIKYGAVEKVFSNLGVFDFDEKTKRMRLRSVHTGVTLQQVIENTGFELIIPDPVPETRPPTEEELFLMREVVDPSGIRRLDFVKGDAYKQIMKEITTGTTYEMLYGK